MIKSFLIVYKMLLENSRSSFMEFCSQGLCCLVQALSNHIQFMLQ